MNGWCRSVVAHIHHYILVVDWVVVVATWVPVVLDHTTEVRILHLCSLLFTYTSTARESISILASVEFSSWWKFSCVWVLLLFFQAVSLRAWWCVLVTWICLRDTDLTTQMAVGWELFGVLRKWCLQSLERELVAKHGSTLCCLRWVFVRLSWCVHGKDCKLSRG